MLETRGRRTPRTNPGRRPGRLLALLTSTLLLLLAAPLTAQADTIGPPVFGPPVRTTVVGEQGTTLQEVACGKDSYVKALVSALEGSPRHSASAAPVCESLRVDNGAVVFGKDNNIPGRIGASSSNDYSAPCDDGWALVGVKASVPAPGSEVDGLQVLCRQILANGALGKELSGWPYPLGSGTDQVTVTCPDADVVTGVVGTAADNPTEPLRAFGLTCRPLTFPPTAPDEVNTAWPTALRVEPTSTTTGKITLPGQDRWYRFLVQPGARVSVDLTDLSADYDLAVFTDIGKSFDTLTSTADLTRLSAEFAGDAFAPSVFSPSVFSPSVFSPSVFSPSVFSPSVFSPSVFSPSVFSPSVFSPSVFSPSVFSPSVFSPSVFSPAVSLPSVFSPSVFSPSVFSPSVLADAFASAQTRSLIGVSAHDGTAAESVSTATWNNTGYFYVRVSGRNGAASATDPFTLRVTSTDGICSSELKAFDDDPTLSGTPGVSTVILTDPARMGGTADEKAALAAKLSSFASSVNGVVVDLGASKKVADLNAQADSATFLSCPYAKNLVAQAARDVVNSYRDGAGTLKYVVVVGADGVVPFFRYPDTSGLGPESGYVPPVADRTASQASLKGNYVLGQDAYGARSDLTVKGTAMPVPDLAVGRLVETPAEVTSALQGFLARGGAPLKPTSTLATGYDFLSDAASAVATDFRDGTPGGRHDELITKATVPPSTTTPVGGSPSPDTSWTATDLRRALLGSRHDMVFLAGHFSANNTLAADYATTVGSAEVAAAPDSLFRDSLVFSAGCHSGYTIVDGDGVPAVTDGLDWTEAFARRGATLLAGTGYQYGDTDFLAYSEKIYAGFAHQLRVGSGAVPVGQALVRAKQDYLSSAATLSGIDQKALLESALYGLPMLGVELPAAGRVAAPSDTSIADPAAVTTGPGGVLGLRSGDVTLNPQTSVVPRTLTNLSGGTVDASYLTGRDGVVTRPAEPALPLQSENVSVAGQVLRGVALRSATYTDTDGITPLTGAPATETHGVHNPFVSSAFYPARLATPNYFDALDEDGAPPVTRLQLTPVQHRTDAPGSLTDTRRAYSSVTTRLFYSADTKKYGDNVPALAAPPSITGVTSTVNGDGTVTLAGQVVGDPSAGIQGVWVTYTGEKGSPLHRRWQSLDLAQDSQDSTRWSAVLTLPGGQDPAAVRYLVQAVNGVGLVGIDDNQGSYYTPGVAVGTTVPAQAPTTLTLGSGTATSTAYGSSLAVSATLQRSGTGLAGRAVTFSLGGASRTAYTDGSGRAATTLPVSVLPGGYTLSAAYDGDATTAASATAPVAVTVLRQPTSLALGVDVAAGTATATLKDASGLPLREKAVYLAYLDSSGKLLAGKAVITDYQGRAVLPLAGRPATVSSLVARFGAADTPLPGGGTADLSDPSYEASGPVSAPVPSANPPTAAADAYRTPQNTTLTVAAPGVLANDTRGATTGTLTAVVADKPATGSLTLNADGSFTYAPAADAVGTVTFTYTAVRDGVASSPATVTITVTEPVPPGCTITGTPGNDVLRGTSGRDVICGLGGNDVISGGGGDDVVYGGSGDDTVALGNGNDTVYAGSGRDTVDSGSGVDVVRGEGGDDTLTSGLGNDTVEGGDGSDTIDSGSGDDVVRAGAGTDTVSAGDGADAVDVKDGQGGDRVDGGAGKDTCTADKNDTVTNVP